MKYAHVLVLLLAVAIAAGCSTPTPAPTTASLGKDFTLKLGQTAILDDGLVVTFQDVPTDGRCSSCTASFYAAIDLRMTPPGKPPVAVRIDTPPLSKVEGDTSPYTVKFVSLQPQRNLPIDNINRADYILTLVISKSN